MDATENILTDLKSEKNSAFGVLYKKHFGLVKRFITNNSGNTNDAEDVFQDTMIALLNKLRQDNFVLTASVKTYIMAIAKYIWLKKLRTPNYTTELTEANENIFYEEITVFIEQEKTYLDKLQNYIHQTSSHCQGLIYEIFFNDKSIEQIQQKYGYSSKHNAINQKHKCVEQIRKVKEKEDRKLQLLGSYIKK